MGNTAAKPCSIPSTSNNKPRCCVLKNSENSSEAEQIQQQYHEQQRQQFLNGSYSNEPPPMFTCEICVEEKHIGKFFNAENCTHSYCIECIVKYIESKLQDNALILTCPRPKCPGVLESSYCRRILPYKVLMRWQKALCEQAIPEDVKFYCPFKDCSALLINEGDTNKSEVITHSVCPHCGRNICVYCKAPWHTGFSCLKFQMLKHREDALMMDLAHRRKWKRCPKCKNYVEKKNGCDLIKCRCKHGFCYRCGQSMASNWQNFMHTCAGEQELPPKKI